MSMDDTTLETLSYLEARLLRIEYVLYGHTAPSAKAPAITSLHQLEHRFATLLQRVSTYKDLLRIFCCQTKRTRTSSTRPAQHPRRPPSVDSLLPPDALEQIVLAAAPSYPATASALTSIADTPVPEPALSASLAALLPRMKGIEATQAAQRAEMAELRARSEACVRQWYENSIVGYSDFVANAEGRIERVERGVRRVEKAREEV
ncbi:NADH-quinone oxidoreductase [Apiospora arundinis]